MSVLSFTHPRTYTSEDLLQGHQFPKGDTFALARNCGEITNCDPVAWPSVPHLEHLKRKEKKKKNLGHLWIKSENIASLEGCVCSQGLLVDHTRWRM